MADKRISQLVDRGTVANNDVVPIVVSGATTTNKATISSIQTFMQGNLDLGVTSVGITLGSSGTDVSVSGSPITSSGNITINLPTASAVNRGALSSADWTTFNSKQQAITLTTTGTSGAATLVSGTLNIPNYSTDLSGYVTLGTTQTITAQKTFTTSGSSDTMIISHGSGSGFALDVLKAGNGEAIRVTKSSGSGNAMTISGGNFEAPTIVKTGGTSSQFLKADGSVDSNTYLTTGTAASTYVPYSGATGNVDLGTRILSANNLIANGGFNSGALLLKNANAASLIDTGYFKFSPNSSNTQISFGFSTGASTWKQFSFSSHLITDNTITIFTLPNGGGTLALTTDLSGYLPLTGGTLSNNLFITGGGLQVSGSASANRQVVELYTSSTVSRLAASYVGSSSYGDLELLTGGLARLTITAAGAATFSGALNGTSATFSTEVTSSGGQGRFGGWATGAGYQGNALEVGVSGGNAFMIGYNRTSGSYIPLFIGGTTNQTTTIGGSSIVFQNNGVTALTIASTGAATFSSSVGIGITPSGSDGVFQINASAGTLAGTAKRSATIFSTSAENADRPGIILGYDTAGGGVIAAATQASGQPLNFWTYNGSSWGERMRITSGGFLKAKGTETTYLSVNSNFHELRSGVGNEWTTAMSNTSGSPYGLYIIYSNSAPNNNTNYFIVLGDQNADRFRVSSNGNVTNQNGSYGSISDAKLKENILDATPKLDDLMKVRIRNYNLIGEETKQIGVIAQELEEVFPAMIDESQDFEEVEVPQLDEEGNEVLNEEGEVVTEKQRVSKGTSTKSVKYSVFVPMLIKAIQELKTEIDSLKNQIK